MSADFPSAPAPSGTPAAPAAATELVYADVPNRIIAYILDAILIAIFTIAVGAILLGLGLTGLAGAVVQGIVGLLIGAGYFIYTWTRMRGTLGMRALGMQIGNAGDGATMTTTQGVRRYVALSAPAILAQVFNGVPLIGPVIGLAGLIWYIWLLYSTAQSPTKQGWHDTFANTQVVKAARAV